MCICSRFAEPYIPPITGMSSFTGHVLHSQIYRQPEDIDGDRILCLGAGTSAEGIALDLARQGKQVWYFILIFYKNVKYCCCYFYIQLSVHKCFNQSSPVTK